MAGISSGVWGKLKSILQVSVVAGEATTVTKTSHLAGNGPKRSLNPHCIAAALDVKAVITYLALTELSGSHPIRVRIGELRFYCVTVRSANVFHSCITRLEFRCITQSIKWWFIKNSVDNTAVN